MMIEIKPKKRSLKGAAWQKGSLRVSYLADPGSILSIPISVPKIYGAALQSQRTVIMDQTNLVQGRHLLIKLGAFPKLV